MNRASFLSVNPNLEPPRPHRLLDVLERLETEVIASDLGLAPDLAIGVVRNANTTRCCNAFKAGSNVDTVAEDVVVIDDDVADMDTNAKFDALILRHGDILIDHAALDFKGTTYRVYGAGKLDQHSVTGCLDDAPAMRGDNGIDEGLSDSLKPSQRAFLVGTHKAAVPGDISRQYRCQTPLDALGGQGTPLNRDFDYRVSKHIGLPLG